jgi:hypothetical protein
MDQGRLVEAEEKFKQAIQEYKNRLGPYHTLTLRAINNLGVLYSISYMNKLDKAEEMF